MGRFGSPGRRKYECRECTFPFSTVLPAATSAWAATWPPKTRWRVSLGLDPRKMFTSICSRSRRSQRSSRAFVTPQTIDLANGLADQPSARVPAERALHPALEVRFGIRDFDHHHPGRAVHDVPRADAGERDGVQRDRHVCGDRAGVLPEPDLDL